MALHDPDGFFILGVLMAGTIQRNRLGSGGMGDKINAYCAECGTEGGVSLKACKSCMSVKYCNAVCQKKHWATHKKQCKERAAKLRDEALFKDPPPKAECPICFLPMPTNLISCVSLPPATISSVPIHDFAMANEELAKKDMEVYYPCCGKTICAGCDYSFDQSGNGKKCPFCSSQRYKTAQEHVEEIRRRVEANDPTSTCLLANSYHHGTHGFQEDHAKAIELYARAADLGHSMAHNQLGGIYNERGDMKKVKFHYEAGAMAGHEDARFNLGCMEAKSGNMERAIKHWKISASAGHYYAMFAMITLVKKGRVSKESIN